MITAESLFIAGCVGAMAPSLVRWMISKQRVKDPTPTPTFLLYVLIGGYFGSFIVESRVPYQAFCAGLLMDLAFFGIRRFGMKVCGAADE
jgi:hypothetical protein